MVFVCNRRFKVVDRHRYIYPQVKEGASEGEKNRP